MRIGQRRRIFKRTCYRRCPWSLVTVDVSILGYRYTILRTCGIVVFWYRGHKQPCQERAKARTRWASCVHFLGGVWGEGGWFERHHGNRRLHRCRRRCPCHLAKNTRSQSRLPQISLSLSLSLSLSVSQEFRSNCLDPWHPLPGFRACTAPIGASGRKYMSRSVWYVDWMDTWEHDINAVGM